MSIYNPRQTVLLTCRGGHVVVGKEVEKDDVVPCSWHSPVSSHPPMYAVSLDKKLMAVSIIRDSGCFVVNFVPFSMANIIKRAMGISGEFLEKCDALGVHEMPCEKLVDCFKLKEALGWLECEVVEEKELGDHIMFIAKVLSSYIEHDDKRPFLVDGDKFTTTLY